MLVVGHSGEGFYGRRKRLVPKGSDFNTVSLINN